MKKELTNFIRQQALELGFDACGVAKAEFLEKEHAFYTHWLELGFHAEMSYLERNLEKRFDPRVMVEGCQSVVVVLMNYYPSEIQKPDQPQIAKYAYGKIDYHTVIREKLKELERRIIGQFGQACFNPAMQHLFVDSAPVTGRVWAERAGLGWVGRNQMLIHPQFGSHCFLGELFVNQELEYDLPMKNRCGTCRKCMDACPTKALTERDGLDTRRCISYQTIENKNDIDSDVRNKLSGCVFGCDICNDVCPWNKSRNKSHNISELEPIKEILEWKMEDWRHLTQEKFNEIFKYSALKRAGFAKLKQNIGFE